MTGTPRRPPRAEALRPSRVGALRASTAGAGDTPPPRSDRGSALPLVLGIVTCLLLLSVGVTAATSAFLERGRLQGACDGAASVATDIARESSLLGGGLDAAAALGEADRYLRLRDDRAHVDGTVDTDGAALSCRTTAPITFGAIFGVGEIDLVVRSAARSIR